MSVVAAYHIFVCALFLVQEGAYVRTQYLHHQKHVGAVKVF